MTILIAVPGHSKRHLTPAYNFKRFDLMTALKCLVQLKSVWGYFKVLSKYKNVDLHFKMANLSTYFLFLY